VIVTSSGRYGLDIRSAPHARLWQRPESMHSNRQAGLDANTAAQVCDAYRQCTKMGQQYRLDAADAADACAPPPEPPPGVTPPPNPMNFG
jgi:hypothetical protein